jgi:hypothetical protein
VLLLSRQRQLHLFSPGMQRGRNRGSELFSGCRRRVPERPGDRRMSMTKQSWIVLVAMASAAAPSCDRGEAPAPTTPPTTASKVASAQPARPAPPPLPLGAVPATDDKVPDAGVSATDRAIIKPGQWSENRQYKFRFERIAACGRAAESAGPAQQPAAGAPGQLRGETSWVGAFFSVEAKQPQVFVTPRDLELRRGGVILSARHINQPLLEGCAPLLPAKALQPGESVAGFALFEVPKSFRKTTDDPIVLSYRPTRWGGSRRVEVPVRECLDACPESAVRRASKTEGNGPPSPRKL